MLGSKFVKLSILKRQGSSSSIFVSFFIVMKHNSAVNLKLIHFLLWPKGSHQSSNFDTFECFGENLSNSSSFSKQQISFSSNFASLFNVWKITPLYVFSSNNIYFVQKEPIKVKIFETVECSGQDLSNSLCQFWNYKPILLQFLYSSSVSLTIIPLYFFSSNNIYFVKKESIKVKMFEAFVCSVQNSSNSSCQFWILHHSSLSLHITPLWILNPHFFLLWIKEFHQNPNFETFKCSGENLPYSSCHFPNHKSVFLQIFHDPSVSWKITPLYLFRSNRSK